MKGMLPTHTEQFKIGLIQATGSQIPTVPGVSRHVSLCRIPRQMLSFPPTLKLWRLENMTAAGNHFVRYLRIIALSQMPWKLILSCLAIIQMRNKFLIDIMMSCYIPDRMSHKIFIQETAKMCNWENYIDTIFFFFVNWEKTTITCVLGWNTFIQLDENQCLVVWEPWLKKHTTATTITDTDTWQLFLFSQHIEQLS